MFLLAGWTGWHSEEVDSNRLLHRLLSNSTGQHVPAAFHTFMPWNSFAVAAGGSLPVTIVQDGGRFALLQGRALHQMGMSMQQQREEFLRSWMERYQDCLREGIDEFRGGFCLVATAHGNRELLVAIDRMGVAPLAYHHTNSALIFASSARSVNMHPLVTGQIGEQAIYDYLYFHVIPSPETIYSNISKLEPSHYLHYHDGQLDKGRYWKPSFQAVNDTAQGDLVERLHTTLEAAVGHCRPDKKTGTFLSGGIDSSTVTGLAAKQLGTAVDAFSIGFDAPGYDEMEYARIAARHFACRHHEYYVTPENVEEAIQIITDCYDEPYGNSSAIPVYFCARLAKEYGLRRLLAGDGGDELFAGNSRYLKQKIYDDYLRLPKVLRKSLLEPLINALPGDSSTGFSAKLKRFISDANKPLALRLQRYNFLERTDHHQMFTPEFLHAVDPRRPGLYMTSTLSQIDYPTPLDGMLLLDWKITLADNDLRKVNVMCAAAGIEACYPMLDPDLVDLATEIPARMKIKNRTLRFFYKKAMAGFLPNDIIDKKKHGFGLPFGVWLRDCRSLNELARDSLSDFARRGYIRDSFVDNLFARHRERHAAYYGEIIWVIMMLELWLRRHHP